MKIIALIPFHNEALFLPACLQSLQGIADEILGYDDDESIDGSATVFASYGGLVKLPQSFDPSWAAGKQTQVRKLLLEWGRERGGTHFIWLDANEVFTVNFRKVARGLMADLHPGHKLLLHWLVAWKDTLVYRFDPPFWDRNYKDFIVCDDPGLSLDEVFIHFGRTQGPNTPEIQHTVPLEKGAVIDMRYAFWNLFQCKQCWYRCVELCKNKGEEDVINEIYAGSLEDSSALCVATPREWLDGLTLPQSPDNLYNSRYYKEILALFNEYGPSFFEGLDIWHVPELRKEFYKKTGRFPDQQAVLRKILALRVIKYACNLPGLFIKFLRKKMKADH